MPNNGVRKHLEKLRGVAPLLLILGDLSNGPNT